MKPSRQRLIVTPGRNETAEELALRALPGHSAQAATDVITRRSLHICSNPISVEPSLA